MATPTLAYWKIRGLAQSIRMMLLYTGTEFEDIRYQCGEDPPYDRSSWTDVKETIGLDFPNIPYYIDGDIKISQSNAIIKHIGRKNDLVGKTDLERAHVDMMLDQAMDFRNNLVMMCYFNTPDTIEAKKEEYKTKVAGALKLFNKYINGRTFFVSNEVTVIDFVMYELLDQHRTIFPTLLNDYQNIVNFMKTFESTPKLSSVLKSEKLFKGPMNNPMSLVN